MTALDHSGAGMARYAYHVYRFLRIVSGYTYAKSLLLYSSD